jgi:Holliday junction DNA helicase RuvA
MISHLRGKLVEKTPTLAVIETGGVGFHVHIPLSSYRMLGEIGQETLVLTYLHVREDVLQLYGFATQEERKLFLLLLSVSGVGPKVAQGILSSSAPESFGQAVAGGDIAFLTQIPGIGRKTAERLVLELKDKVREVLPKKEAPGDGRISVQREAALALVSLGFKQSQAEETVRKICQQDAALPLEELLRCALNLLR